MSPRIFIAAVVALASTTVAPLAHADGKNEIRAVTFDESSGTTNVHVRGADTPTFTVYKLERPSRVVVDIPQARLSDAMRSHDSAAVFTPNTWAVSTIAAQQLDDNAVRVVVTMARPGRYDVKTVGNEVVVMVMPRDAAPKTANPEDLVRAQQQASAAETARAAAQQQAEAANATAKQSHAEAEAAKADAERLRKTAADQAAKAEAAQRAVEQAKHASAADLEAAKATAMRAKQDADAAKAAAANAQLEAERTRKAADKAKQDALAEASAAKADASAAKADAAKAHGEAAEAQQALAQTRAQAEQALAQSRAEAERAKADAAKQTREARDQLAAAQREVANAKSEAAKRAAEADAAQKQAAAARAEAAQRELEANAARDQINAAKTESREARDQILAAKAEAAANANAATAAKSEAANAKAEAARARHEAELAKTDAEAARVAAAADKKKAEAARGEAERMMKDAKTQLATLDQKMATAQGLEDKARATSAAAQAREEAARDAEAKANRERAEAELAAKQAQDAQTRVAASERARAAADAKAAGERLAQARRATEEAEAQRRAAQTAAEAAKHELEQTRSTLATVEQQRTTAVAAASEAARKRSDAEAAASDATRRRSEAELAAADAAKLKKAAELAASDAMQKKTQAERERADAEAQRVAALDAAKSAQAARDAAEKQRKVAEKAAQVAVAAKASAEDSLAELTAKQKAAEKAAGELEARSKAEAKAQAQVAALAAEQTAQTRKANDQELAKAKSELAKLSADRTRAETELADRRKAVAEQQAEASRLATAATQAHDAASREETRRAELAQKRGAEEAELAKLARAKADAEAAKREAVASAKADAEAAKREALAAKAEAEKVKAQVRVAQADLKPEPKVDAKPAKADKVSKVTAIDFKGDGGNGQVSIAVDGGAEIQVGEVTATHAELIVDNADLAQKLERTLDVSKFGSPVRTVSSFRDRRTPNRVRLVAELAQAATPTVERDGGAVRWHFIGNEIAKRPVKITNAPSPVVGGFGAASTPLGSQTVTQLPAQGSKRRVYHGAVVDLDVKDAPLHDLLRLLADTGHISIVVPESIDPKITVKLKRVPWDQALEVILQSYGLWYRRDGTIFRVASQKDLDAEDAAEAARRDAAIKAEAPRVERINLNYASAAEIKPTLETLKSPHGTIEVDTRTNALIISDVAANRAEMVRLAYELDTQTPQISIEARIVEARSTFLREIGVQWGGNAIAGAAGGNATGLVWPSSIGITGANSDAATVATGVAAPSDFAVNLPAATGAGEGGALGFSLGSIGGNFNINLRLSALEDSGNVRIISAPKVTVLSNREAKISQGVSIPISVVSAAGTNTQFVQADLALTVTPSVSQRDCSIAMNLVVTKNEPDFVNVGARGDPTILRKEARTYMLVADGETTVLGGIYTRNAGVAYKKVPLLGDIPVLGWLFKNRRENDDRTEILVFITPKITNRGSLPCVK